MNRKKIKKYVSTILIGLVAFGWIGFMISTDEIITTRYKAILILIPFFYIIYEVMYIRSGKSIMDFHSRVTSFKGFMEDNLAVLVASLLSSVVLVSFYHTIKQLKSVFNRILNFSGKGIDYIYDFLSNINNFFADNRMIIAVLGGTILIGAIIVLIKFWLYKRFFKK